MVRAAIYVRVSTDKQEEGYSPETQEAACREYAAARGYTVAGAHVYRETHTGTELWERPQLTHLREAVRRGELDVVIAYAIDRLSRDPVHLGVIVSEAEHHRVGVEFVTEPLDGSPEGELIRFVRGYAAKIEHMKLVERTQRGKRARVQSGKPLRARDPYGLRWTAAENRYREDEREKAVLRRIMAEALAGAKLRAIAGGLNDDAIPSPGGKEWCAPTVRHLLLQEYYTGKGFAYRNKTERREGKWRRTAVPDDHPVPLPDGVYPVIFTPEEQAAVRARLMRNQQESARRNHCPESFLLRAGYVFCGVCGEPMRASHEPQRNLTRYVCAHVAIGTHILDPMVWRKVETVLRKPDIIGRELERMRQDDPTAADLEALERRGLDAARKRDNLSRNLALFSDPAAAEPVVREIELLQQMLAQLERERAAVLARRAGWEAAQARLDELEAWCRHVAESVGQLSYAQKRDALLALGVRVEVYPREHTPRCVVTMGIPLEEEPECTSTESTS